MRALVDRAPMPVRWFIVDAGAITDIDYSAAQSMRDLLDDLARQRVGMVFAGVSRHLRSDMDRHHITAAISDRPFVGQQLLTTMSDVPPRLVIWTWEHSCPGTP